MKVRRRAVATLVSALLSALLLAGCSGTVPAGPDPTPTAEPQLTAQQWGEDLDLLDAWVRKIHPDPFVNHPESEWNARIAELRNTLPTMSVESSNVALIELAALLDTHSGVFPDELGYHRYGLWLYEFADGVWVLNATDPRLVGARVTAINGRPIVDVLDSVAPLINADNESALAWLRADFVIVPELLHALGVVQDIDHPAVDVELSDGTAATVDPPILDLPEYEPLLASLDPAIIPESWTHIGTPIASSVVGSDFVITYNSPDADATSTLAQMSDALAAGAATRVIFDMRHSGGGNFSNTRSLVAALADPSVNQPGRLVVIIGRDNVSASTALASTLEQSTSAVFVGEATPARANPFVDDSQLTLPHSGIIVHVPSTVLLIAGPDDTRDAVRPDIAVTMNGADFFAGRDVVLDAAFALAQ